MKQDRAEFRLTPAAPRIRRFGLLLVIALGFLAHFTPALSAQKDSSFNIRVEAREVMVPVYVAHLDAVAIPNSAPAVVLHSEFNGLAAGDFHVFEDGVEQPVRTLRVERMDAWHVPDNLGEHQEYSATPKGIWSGPEDSLPGPDLPAGNRGKIVWGLGHRWYVVSYVPPPSAEGSCHHIKVTVDRREATIYARDEYCNLKHSPSDPLRGTKVGEQMEEDAVSVQGGNLPLTVQAAATFSGVGAGRVNIAVEFPWRALSTFWLECWRYADVDLLGLVYSKDGTLATRFSHVAYSPRTLDLNRAVSIPGGGSWTCNDRYRATLPEGMTSSSLPTRYETQIDLPPGNYNLRIVVTDGRIFGHADVPVTVDGFDRSSLAVSGIVLCKRLTNIAVAWLLNTDRDIDDWPQNPWFPRGELSTAPEYAPLVSNGMGVTPAGDAAFHKSDRLMSYFEVYEPQLSSGQTKVEFQIRVIDAKTGQVQLNSGLRPAETYAHSGNLIPIGWEIPVDKLVKGAYRVEVQASDSAGKQTAWHTASFTVE